MNRLVASMLGLVCAACAGMPPRTTPLPFRAVEITEDGRELEIPTIGVTDVDINSVIELRLNEPVLRPAMQRSGGIDPIALARIQHRTDLLRSAVAEQEAVLARTLAYLDDPPSGEAATKSAMRDLAALERRALDGVRNVLPDERVRSLLSSGVQEGYAKTIEALESEVIQNDAALARMEAQLETVQLRVLASLQTSAGPIPQHLDGYDSMVEGVPQVVQKVAWRLPPDLQKQLADARALAKELEDLKGLDLALREAVDVRARELIEQLTAAGENLFALENTLATWKTAPWAALDAAKALLTAAETLEREIAPLVASCKPAVDRLPALASDLREAVSELSSSESAVRVCVKELKARAAATQKALQTFAGAANDLLAAAHSDARLAQALTTQGSNDIRLASSHAAADSLDAFVTAWNRIEASFVRASRVATAPPLSPGAHTIDRGYGELQDTRIDLTRTARSIGDTLHWRASVVQDGLEARAWSSPTLRVVSTGLRLDVSAAVIFVKAFEAQPRDDSFPAAAAVTAAFHYRVERASRENHSGDIWNFLNPGVGIHVAYLDLGASRVNEDGGVETDDPSNEIGLGGVVQLFGDVLTAGVGYDLQAARSYWFLGFGLKTMTDLGITVPGSPSN